MKMNKNDMVWYFNLYDELSHGIIVETHYSDNFYNVKTRYGTYSVTSDRCFPDKESCCKDRHQRRETAIKTYMNEMNNLEDIIRFMYTHSVSLAEEYTDWEAREAVCRKAKEFDIMLEE